MSEKNNVISPELWAPLEQEEKNAEKMERPSLTFLQDGWRRLKSNKIAILSLIVIALITIGAIFIPMFWKYDYKTQNLELANIPDVMKVYPLDNGKNIYVTPQYTVVVVDKKGNRLVGSHIDKEVASQVIEDGQEYFSQNVDVMGVRYFGYYVPIRNDENEVVGVSFAGESAESVNTSMRFMTHGNVIICLFIIILAGFICNLSAQKMVEAIQAIKRFLGRVAHGEFHHEMPENVLKRGDELAQMGEYAVAVSDSLEEMVSRDPLTKLLNRRAAQIQMDYRRENDCFSLAIADIDFFKSVNDSYGHEKGDEVLKYVAGALQKAVGEDGFSARWGGEEFLIGFDGTVNETRKVLQGFLDDVKSKKFSHNGMEFSISLTIGIATYCEEEKMEEAINRADELLYYGKEHGRDQIVMESREEES